MIGWGRLLPSATTTGTGFTVVVVVLGRGLVVGHVAVVCQVVVLGRAVVVCQVVVVGRLLVVGISGLGFGGLWVGAAGIG